MSNISPPFCARCDIDLKWIIDGCEYGWVCPSCGMELADVSLMDRATPKHPPVFSNSSKGGSMSDVTDVTKGVICKLFVAQLEDVPNVNGDPGKKIRMGGVWEGSVEKQAESENAIFGRQTPHAALEMTITNPPAAAFFKPGKRYYLTFTEAPDQ